MTVLRGLVVEVKARESAFSVLWKHRITLLVLVESMNQKDAVLKVIIRQDEEI